MPSISNSFSKIIPFFKNAGEFIKSEEDCGECIQRFINLYSSWNEKLENCSVADIKHIKTIFAKYKERCFNCWFNDSSTILVIGPKTIVEEVQNLIKSHLKNIQLTANSTAQPFNYEDVEGAIMRFVSFGKTYKDQLSLCLTGLANVEIVQKDETLSVHVSPTQMSSARLHMDFENECRMKLKQFFMQFTLWKGNVDLAVIARLKHHRPDLFETKNFQDHYVRWFMDTGVVNVVGISWHVQRCRSLMEKLLGASTIHSLADSQPFLTPAPIHGRPFPTPVPLLHVIPPQQVMNGATSKHNAERSRKLSSEDFSDESSSSSKAAPMNTVQFDTKDFKPDVLRFVFNDAFAKKNLGSCCGKLAKVSITYDQKRQIKVHITFRKKNPSDVDKSRALEQVGKYFDQFSAETNKYDANKIKTVMEKFPKLFCEEFGVFVQASLSKGTIKYAGVKENVKKRINEIEYEIKSERREERLSVDVFIAQRECGLWKKTEQKCLNKGHQVSITPFKEGKIAYKGDLNAIQLAKTTLGELYMKTIRKPVEDLTPDQLTFLKKCENSQKKSLGTKKNILDDLYRQFKKENVKGSLAFRDSEVSLVVGNNTHWQTANRLLKESIEEFDISPSDYKKDTPFPEVVANLKKAFRDEIVHLKSERDSRKVIVFCFNFQHKQMRMKVIKTIEQMGDMNDIEKFYPMSREKAEHVANHCKIDKAKSVVLVTESTGTGLLVTLEKEDIDTVDMKLEDLEKEIKKIEKQFTGHSLYDYLSGEGIFIKKATELETKCSIFLDSVEQKSSSTLITVKLGDILQEKCDAIVNSTGKSLEFSGQVSTALKKRFGTDLLEAVLKNSKWVMENQLCICDTGGQLPWKYIVNISTPTGKSEFTSAILYLLKEAEKLGVQSLALPTIGAGNIGLDPTVVASYMKDAFARFDAQKSLLQDIRVVVFQSSQLSVFQDIIPKQGINKLETRMTVKMYGSSVASLDEAMKKFEESCDKIIKSFVIKTTRPEFYGFEKSEIEKFCRVNDVLLEWKSTKNVEECHIQGLSDNVKKVKDLIDKLLEEDYPTSWSSMSDGQNVKRVELSEISPEYLDVKRKFEESQPSYSRLIKIERVQNKLLYSQFKDRRNAKKVEFAGQNKVITRQLFHGTSFDTVDKICASGFDRNFSGKNGTVYGCGVYFAVKSQYSVGYSRDQTKYMFLSEVITGDYILGNYKYKAPPEKSQSTRYDSCVDNQSNPTIFVVFSDSSVYPSYIITFQ